MPHHVEAAARLDGSPGRITAEVGDARELPVGDESFDAERDLREGQHRNPDDRPHRFTTAYAHHPAELREEAEAAGVRVVDVLGVEGLAHWLPQLADRWSTDEGKEAIVFAARAVESEPALLGLSGHLIAVARPARTA